MRKIKILFSLIILLCLTIIVTSNWAFFSGMYSFEINLYKPVYNWPFDLKLQKLVYRILPAANGIYLLGCFILGALFISFRNLLEKFRNSRQIKDLENENKLQLTKIADLEKEIDFLKRSISKPGPPKPTVTTAPAEKTADEAKDASNENGDTKIAE